MRVICWYFVQCLLFVDCIVCRHVVSMYMTACNLLYRITWFSSLLFSWRTVCLFWYVLWLLLLMSSTYVWCLILAKGACSIDSFNQFRYACMSDISVFFSLHFHSVIIYLFLEYAHVFWSASFNAWIVKCCVSSLFYVICIWSRERFKVWMISVASPQSTSTIYQLVIVAMYMYILKDQIIHACHPDLLWHQ